MNYRMVKQFSNNAIDNFFNFFYKLVDFGKVWMDVFWAFFEIWEAFFLIFYNIFMYFYYLILLAIDKSATESQSVFFIRKRIAKRVAFTPQKVYTRETGSPASIRYGRQAASKVAATTMSVSTAAKEAVTETVSSAAEKIRVTPSAGKGSFRLRLLTFFDELFKSILGIVKAPFLKIVDFFATKLKPVRDQEQGASGSLIDEYMKEYEQKKRR
ncbi:MAG TPA: hypothetical protein PK200_10655 [Spirochaetota bacterium]|nr:hypothetical protein [Spirochaetota bacterium]HQO00785.1 hypothetical protein [Spirochaetota bacterium]HQP49019.1 hypothetical protein [Spirochaetota bacterium]